ncbi:hypothetical protein [Moorella sp. E308F]|uniref:hypothetical protein n=1 Tax=Moorella sp. E308F TaxID=2572682 RepID=UPI001C0F0AD5|nr:hypothetical protein [Moorella sp. E308F]
MAVAIVERLVQINFFNLKFFGGSFCFTPPDALEIKAWPFRAAEHHDPYRKFFKNVIASR